VKCGQPASGLARRAACATSLPPVIQVAGINKDGLVGPFSDFKDTRALVIPDTLTVGTNRYRAGKDWTVSTCLAPALAPAKQTCQPVAARILPSMPLDGHPDEPQTPCPCRPLQVSGTSSAAPGVAIQLCSKAHCEAGGTRVTTAAIRTTAGAAAGAPSPWTVSSASLAMLSMASYEDVQTTAAASHPTMGSSGDSVDCIHCGCCAIPDIGSVAKSEVLVRVLTISLRLSVSCQIASSLELKLTRSHCPAAGVDQAAASRPDDPLHPVRVVEHRRPHHRPDHRRAPPAPAAVGGGCNKHRIDPRHCDRIERGVLSS
jgi:hypothetical protein